MIDYYYRLVRAESLKQLSESIHFLIVLLLLIQTICVSIFRYFNFPILITYINLGEISVYLLSVIFFIRKKYIISTLVAAYGIPVIFAIVVFYLKFPFKSCFWFLLSFEIIYILILRGKLSRLLYAVYCGVIFFIPGILIGYSYPENIIKFAQISTLITIPILLSNFIESQDRRLQILNKELEKKYEEKEIYAKKIAEKNQELVVFSQIMSHDLKSPLRSIKSFATLLERNMEKGKNGAENLEFINFISNSSDVMSDLINELLNYSKIEVTNYPLEEISLNDVVAMVLPLFQFDIVKKNVQINVKQLPNIRGNASILKTVFQNLLSNSIKYQPKDKEEHYPEITIWSKEEKDKHYIFLKDNGIGIEQTYINDLFTPFRRFHSSVEYKGTGLGMSICQRIINKHNGDIKLYETSKNGTTFRLAFPKI